MTLPDMRKILQFSLQFVEKEAAIDGSVIERNAVLVLEIHHASKIRVAGDETTQHSTALVGKELSDAVVEHFQLFRIAKAYAIFWIEEDCRARC